MKRDLTFGELRRYISRIDRLSICRKETLQYENYRWMKDVPEEYDSLYVYGIGKIESEFPKEMAIKPEEFATSKDYFFAECIEIMVSETPVEE